MAKSKYASKPRFNYDTKSPRFHQGAWKNWENFSAHGRNSQAFAETASNLRASPYQRFVEPWKFFNPRPIETVWAK